MHTHRTRGKQRGFFDLGFSLGLMLLFSGTAAVLEPANSEQENLAKPETEVIEQTQEQVVAAKTDQE